MTNREIVDIYLDNGLIKRCVDCQFSYLKDRQFRDDFFNDLIVILLTYDNDKLNDVHTNNHFNAFVTRIIIQNIFSKTRPYYKDYRKFTDHIESDITIKMKETIADE